jgi:hypothetical protein
MNKNERTALAVAVLLILFAAILTKPTDFCSYGERMVSEDA